MCERIQSHYFVENVRISLSSIRQGLHVSGYVCAKQKVLHVSGYNESFARIGNLVICTYGFTCVITPKGVCTLQTALSL
jgi:hypothetical protein